MEEERILDPTPDSSSRNQGPALLRVPRDDLPAYYSVKIECFTKLVELKIEKYESAMFHAGGFNWRLILYPNGNTKEGVEGHISLFLAIDKTDTLPPGWEVYVTFKMFVFDPHKNEYLTLPDDSVHQIRRFHQAKKESGFDRLISLDTFKAATNLYLIKDSCVFGVHVYEVKYAENGEALKMIENPEEVTFKWKVCTQSIEDRKQLYSEKFTVGKHKWRLLWDLERTDHLSLYLELAESPSTVKKVLAEYSMVPKCCHRFSCIRYKETSGYKWFSTAELTTDVSSRWGFSWLPLITTTTDISEVEAKVNIKAEVTNFS